MVAKLGKRSREPLSRHSKKLREDCSPVEGPIIDLQSNDNQWDKEDQKEKKVGKVTIDVGNVLKQSTTPGRRSVKINNTLGLDEFQEAEKNGFVDSRVRYSSGKTSFKPQLEKLVSTVYEKTEAIRLAESMELPNMDKPCSAFDYLTQIKYDFFQAFVEKCKEIRLETAKVANE